jgi:Short-chain dehydrogenases of various substrate specificities
MRGAIVTGASSGIGLEICKVLLKREYKVYGFGRDFSKTGLTDNNFVPVICDLTDTAELSNKIKSVQDREDIHILVNNAGVGYFGPHEELNPKKIREMVATNLEVPMILAQLLLRTLKKNAGYIINISSVTALKSNTHGCAYGASKAGLSSFSKSLFDEVRKYGVKVVTIHPDMTKTDFYRNADFSEGEAEDTYLKAEEVAKAVEFVLDGREGMVVSEITLQPQKHQIRRKSGK